MLLFTMSLQCSFAQVPVWVSKFEAASFNNGPAYIRHTAVDKQGNVYVVGAFNKSVYFAGTTIVGNWTTLTGFVLKLTRNGALSWVKSLPGLSSDATGVAVDTLGNIFMTGQFEGTVDFDPSAATNNITAIGDKDIFIAKWDTAGNAIWTKTIGGTTGDFSNSIAVKGDGSSIFTTGKFTGTADFDPSAGTSNLTSVANEDAYVLSLDGNGNFNWVKGIFGSGEQSGTSVCLDASNTNLYVGGYFYGTTAFATGGTQNKTSNGQADAFIGKYDAGTGGNPLWVKTIGGTETDAIVDVKQDKVSNSIYIGGYFRTFVDFDPGAGIDTATSIGITYGPTNPHTDGFIVKLDQDGLYQWKSIHSNPALLEVKKLDVDKNGFVYAVGSFTGTATTSYGVTNIFATSQGWAAKLDSTGVKVWHGGYGQQQWDDEATTVSVSDSLDVNIGGDYNRGAPIGYTMNVDLAGASVTTDNGYMSAISQHGQKRPTLVNMGTSYVNWNYAGLYYSWNPENSATTLLVEYGTTMSLGNAQAPIALGSGNSNVFNVTSLASLTGNTKYYYRMTATNIHGSTVSWIDSFTTPQGPIPVINVLDTMIFGPIVTNITSNSATIGNIDVSANNLATNISIEYGFTPAYGLTQTTTPASISGNSPTSITAILTGLTPGLYHFRVKATNAAGSAYSGDLTFIISAPLPLLWDKFTAKDMQTSVQLNWNTFQEINCSYFDVQASSQGIEWHSLQKVQAKNEIDNYYEINDRTSFTGSRYYRLKQVDIDGRSTFSNVIKLHREQTDIFSLYPNPVSEILSIATHCQANVEVITMDGKRVYGKQISPTDNQLYLTELAHGNYILKITTAEKEVYTKYFVKQ